MPGCPMAAGARALGQEARCQIGSRQQMRVQHLERHAFVGEPMARAQHHAHAALAEQIFHHVAVPHHVTGREKRHDARDEVIRDRLARKRQPCQHAQVIARCLASLCVLAVACSRSKNPEGAGAAAPTVSVSAPAAAAEPAAPAAPAGGVPVDSPALVGTLIENERFSVMHPSEYCLDDGVVYAGAPARVGTLNVFTTAAVAPLAGTTVIARGTREPSLLAALEKRGACAADYGNDPRELPQMRSDWVSPEGGFRTTRRKLGRARGLPRSQRDRDPPRRRGLTRRRYGGRRAREPLRGVPRQARSVRALRGWAGQAHAAPREAHALVATPAAGSASSSRPRSRPGPRAQPWARRAAGIDSSPSTLTGRAGQVEIDARIWLGSRRRR
jgi:hypothetical protein